MRLRVLSTYFQTVELTTLISISWPVVVFFTLPFQLPISDVKCLASSSGWSQEHTFYAYIYAPLLFFLAIYLNAGKARVESVEWANASGTLTVLTTLWYSPLLQTVTSMFDCSEFPGRVGRFLVSDPSVSCDGDSRISIHIHAFLVFSIVGIGFPLYSFSKIRQLKIAGKLDASSSLSSLYQFYNTAAPYFESVQFLRKAALIGMLSIFTNTNRESNRPIIESTLSLAINGMYVVVLYRVRPFVYFPSSFFGNRNLYQLAEMSGAIASLGGNVLALVASFDEKLVNILGLALAGLNVSFAVLFTIAFSMEIVRAKRFAVREDEKRLSKLEGN